MAGGRKPDALLCPQTGEIWVGVDRGIGYLLELGLQPQIIFGDFDSIEEKYRLFIASLSQEQKVIYPSEKDETDLELALAWAVNQKPTEIRIYGATGGRLDHELANIDLLYYYLTTPIRVIMVDEYNEWFLLSKGKYQIKKDERFSYISFLPYSFEVEELTLKGFKYELENKYVEKGRTLTISNEIPIDAGTISFTSGIVLVIKSTDSKLDSLQ